MKSPATTCHVPRRLLPPERWIADRLVDRFDRFAAEERAPIDVERKHGRIGRAVYTLAMLEGAGATCVALIALVALVATDGARWAQVTIGTCIAVEIYALLRCCQAGLIKPDGARRPA